MAGRRGCVNSLWSGTERVRIGERLKATLAGVLELELLRCKHLEMVDGALEDRAPAAADAVEPQAEEGNGTPESAASDAEHGPATSRRQQAPSPSDVMVLPCQSSPEDCGSNSGDGTVHPSSARGSNSRWSTLSWDAPSDLLSPPTPDPSGMVHLDSDSRPSSGFYSVSGSSLSDSCYSVSSDAAQGGPAPPARPVRLWEQVPLSADNTDILWSEGAVQQQQQQLQQQEQHQQEQEQEQPVLQNSQEEGEPTEGTPVSVASDLEATGLSFLSDLCSGLGDSLIVSLLPLLDPISSSSTSSLHPKPQLDSRYCTDLVSRRTKEVYSYPSPLHAVALQSPLFTSQSLEQSASLSPDGPQHDESLESNTDPALPLQSQQPPTLASFTQLEQYISRLARQYHSRVTTSTCDLTAAATPSSVVHRGLCTPGKSHGSTQSLSAFESRSTPSTLPGGSITPCKSLLGNSARVSLSTSGKKAIRNSINLGNLPSATGEDLNINLHLNLNLNLAPGLNSSQGLMDNPKNGNCGALRSDFTTTPTASASSLSSATPTPALRARPRISTCPSSLSHRSSLEVTSASGPSSGFGSSAFCRSLDWSSGAPPEVGPTVFGTSAGSAPGSQRSSLIQDASSSPKLSEDSPMVGEISRLSGLSRAVVVGLMEQGVELDIDCFQTDTAGEVRGHSKTHLTAQTDQSHDYTRLTDLNPQRPIQLSLSVTHSPQSQSSLTPPLSHSSSPIHPYQSIHIPSPHYSSRCHYQQTPSPSDLPSSTASSPASRPTPRGRSPPRPLQPSPLGATPLSVFRRDAPFQCSLPRTSTRTSPLEHGGIQPRGGSLRQGGGGSAGSGGWKRAEGEGLYRGKHTSHKLIRAATVSSYAKREDYSSVWGEEQKERTASQTPRKTSNKFWRGWGKESESEREEMDRAEYGYGWRRNSVGSWRREHRRMKTSSSGNDKRPKVDNSPIFSKKRGKEDGERRSSSLRLSRRALFRSESQGLLVPRNHSEEPTKRAHWVSSLDVGQGGMGISKDEGIRLLRAKEEDKRLSSTASLFNLSRSQSLEGSCHSLSPLSSPSFSPSPPPRMPLQRSRSLRDLGRRVFGSMRSLSLKRKPSKK
ncbi:nuclear pore complex protein DDB_G0274915 isoform X1 [Lates calcarifer]|uniref:Nuclear pore complex protein DDB_G0274915 isoform X1 n=2 Tax=Lates calcarifer TaxID=8187 RepID=A0A4W6F5L6_LATCA|nr:nuclear pore complex protein DDB_G0274915 isoform X1 [Lates calcarifer]